MAKKHVIKSYLNRFLRYFEFKYICKVNGFITFCRNLELNIDLEEAYTTVSNNAAGSFCLMLQEGIEFKNACKV